MPPICIAAQGISGITHPILSYQELRLGLDRLINLPLERDTERARHAKSTTSDNREKHRSIRAIVAPDKLGLALSRPLIYLLASVQKCLATWLVLTSAGMSLPTKEIPNYITLTLTMCKLFNGTYGENYITRGPIVYHRTCMMRAVRLTWKDPYQLPTLRCQELATRMSAYRPSILPQSSELDNITSPRGEERVAQ
jgi:hypothetical protein